MKKILFIITIFVSLLICSVYSNAQYLQVHAGGKITHTINIAEVDYLEIVDDPNFDDLDQPNIKKRMKSMGNISFVYTDGKISQTLEYSIKHYITYTDSVIIRSCTDCSPDTFYLDNGLITKYIKSSNYYHEFTYDNGRIRNWRKYCNGTVDEDISFEWKDGVITRQTEFHPGNSEMELFCDYRYSYTNDPDYGGAVAAFQDDSLFYDNLPVALIIQGYFGKWPKYLVADAIDASGYFTLDRSTTYALDSDGYPIAMRGAHFVCLTWENVE